jgi:signal transduction histidine kinase
MTHAPAQAAGLPMTDTRFHIIDYLGFTPLKHRPPLPRRWELYCVIAYLAPSLMLQFVPAHEVPYRDLVWLVTLVPAYLLSLQFGMRGAAAGLVMGTVLFTTIQFLVAWNLEPEDWRVTLPIYVAYGAIAISVGWLSEQLHLFYERAIEGERVAVVSQVAVAIRHEVNNALATIMAEAQLLQHDEESAEERHSSARHILDMARRVRDSMDRLATLTRAPVTDYVPGVKMIDLEALQKDDPV